ncbi:PqqD family protein [Pseudonocardia sp.]|uniref:PqqD family protein n=1 Tax=Pseudonocardia sp. TaxID=60912 RepID=UPI002611B3E0|nr:PqqD family protein [Pseudonocardia sp.]
MLHLPTSKYLTINGVGSRLFELLAEERSVDELVSTIVAEYEVDAGAARRDIDGFLTGMRTAQLLQ